MESTGAESVNLFVFIFKANSQEIGKMGPGHWGRGIALGEFYMEQLLY